jgi:hypothetical protein
MQGIPDNPFPDGYPLSVRQETDTASPRSFIPIYYIHTHERVFCRNPLCACHRHEATVRRLLGAIGEGAFTLEAAVPLLAPGREETLSSATGAAQTARTVITVDLLPGIPEDCQLYGHSWTHSSEKGAKECRLCGIRGYCPYCVAMPPPNAQPFTCTRHAEREVWP